MPSEETPNPVAATASNAWTGRDVAEILCEQGWLLANVSPAQFAWCERAAALLGPQVSDRGSLADRLHLVFHYDARAILGSVESHAVLSRYAARDVVRQLALALLDGVPLTSERFKEVIAVLKDLVGLRSRELFHPVRLALVGRAGGGDLDRVILLLDEAATLAFVVPVKPARERILEFCAALE
jgi:hypothetical protein